MTRLLLLPALILASSLTLCLGAHAAEHTVSCTELPVAVQEAGKKMFAGATIKQCVKDIDKGKTTYEMETVKDGRSKDVTFDASGTVIGVEEEVEMRALPAAVRDAIRKASDGKPAGKVESVAHGGQIISYETTVARRGMKKEIAFRPDGTAMKPE